jgi:hypothetical protein
MATATSAQIGLDDLRAMVATTTTRRRRTKHQKHPKIHNRTTAIDHAVRVIYRVCCLAGSASLIDKIRADLDADGVRAAMRKRDTAAVFDWLMAALSYQGIADQIAYDYMEEHGYVRWHDINQKFARGASCPKLKSYWHFYGCGYQKLRQTCTEPDHISRCPLPTHDLRNGRLNQTAYCLYLLIRDIADGDLIGWIDQRLQAANSPAGPDRLARMRNAIIAPLREIHGVSDKVLTMALSSILLGAPNRLRLWREVGASMIAVDTLVHNFLHRTGILHRFGADHAYGSARYRPGGCAEIIEAVAERIDASAFNPACSCAEPLAGAFIRKKTSIANVAEIVAAAEVRNKSEIVTESSFLWMQPRAASSRRLETAISLRWFVEL